MKQESRDRTAKTGQLETEQPAGDFGTGMPGYVHRVARKGQPAQDRRTRGQDKTAGTEQAGQTGLSE